jgi:hypothetical protein
MNSKTQTPVGVATEPAVEPAIQVASAPEEAPAPKTAPKTKTTRKPKADVTLAELAERYIKHLEDQGKSPGTCSSYGAELKLAMKELGPETLIASLTPEQVQAYFESKAVTKLRSGKKKAQPSIDKTRRVLRLALVFAAEKKLIASAPIPAPAPAAKG